MLIPAEHIKRGLIVSIVMANGAEVAYPQVVGAPTQFKFYSLPFYFHGADESSLAACPCSRRGSTQTCAWFQPKWFGERASELLTAEEYGAMRQALSAMRLHLFDQEVGRFFGALAELQTAQARGRSPLAPPMRGSRLRPLAASHLSRVR